MGNESWAVVNGTPWDVVSHVAESPADTTCDCTRAAAPFVGAAGPMSVTITLRVTPDDDDAVDFSMGVSDALRSVGMFMDLNLAANTPYDPTANFLNVGDYNGTTNGGSITFNANQDYVFKLEWDGAQTNLYIDGVLTLSVPLTIFDPTLVQIFDLNVVSDLGTPGRFKCRDALPTQP